LTALSAQVESGSVKKEIMNAIAQKAASAQRVKFREQRSFEQPLIGFLVSS
jgi:hypothetical protein